MRYAMKQRRERRKNTAEAMVANHWQQLRYFPLRQGTQSKAAINIQIFDSSRFTQGALLDLSWMQDSAPRGSLYWVCRILFTALLVVVLTVPFVFVVGEESTQHLPRPLFSVYDDSCISEKADQIIDALNSKHTLLLHAPQVEDWHHLTEFADYLGYQLNHKGHQTIARTINLPNVSKKSKKEDGSQSKKSVSAYALSSSLAIPLLRNRLNKAALSIVSRLKITPAKNENNWVAATRNCLLRYLHSGKVWIVRIEPSNWEGVNEEHLRKELQALKKERVNDKFIVVSPAHLDLGKNAGTFEINVDDKTIENVLSKSRKVVKDIVGSGPADNVLCWSGKSLYRLDSFLEECRHSYSCMNSFDILSKSRKSSEIKDYHKDHGDTLKRLCKKGKFDADDIWWSDAAKPLGLGHIDDRDRVESKILFYYELATGKNCKGEDLCKRKEGEGKKDHSPSDDAVDEEPSQTPSNPEPLETEEPVATNEPQPDEVQAQPHQESPENPQPSDEDQDADQDEEPVVEEAQNIQKAENESPAAEPVKDEIEQADQEDQKVGEQQALEDQTVSQPQKDQETVEQPPEESQNSAVEESAETDKTVLGQEEVQQEQPATEAAVGDKEQDVKPATGQEGHEDNEEEEENVHSDEGASVERSQQEEVQNAQEPQPAEADATASQ